MPGVRLHHPDLRNCTFTLIHEGRPLQLPTDCGVCGFVHYHKTYHLGLDNVGDVVVSEEIYVYLKEAGLDELKVLDEIKNPGETRVLMGEKPNTIVVPRERKLKE